MKIYEVMQVTESIVTGLAQLLPQLGPDIQVPDKVKLEQIILSGHTKIIVAETSGKITGTLTIVFQNTPSGNKAWIEDVVVDASARGKGIGEQLVRFAIAYATERGARKIDLTSAVTRTAANSLYQKIGFIKRQTTVYRFGSE